MEKLLNNINKVVVYLIMALGVAFTIYTIANASELTADSAAADKILNPYFLLTLVTFIIAGASVILFPIGQMISNPKNALRAAISIGALALVYLVSWLLSSDSIAEPVYQKFEITPLVSKLIDSMIYMVYILSGISVLAIIVSSINGFLSKR
jgi:hypothetical protein